MHWCTRGLDPARPELPLKLDLKRLVSKEGKRHEALSDIVTCLVSADIYWWVPETDYNFFIHKISCAAKTACWSALFGELSAGARACSNKPAVPGFLAVLTLDRHVMTCRAFTWWYDIVNTWKRYVQDNTNTHKLGLGSKLHQASTWSTSRNNSYDEYHDVDCPIQVQVGAIKRHFEIRLGSPVRREDLPQPWMGQFSRRDLRPYAAMPVLQLRWVRI